MTCQCGPLVAGKTTELNRNIKVEAGVEVVGITVSLPELHTEVIHDLEGFSPPTIERSSDAARDMLGAGCWGREAKYN